VLATSVSACAPRSAQGDDAARGPPLDHAEAAEQQRRPIRDVGDGFRSARDDLVHGGDYGQRQRRVASEAGPGDGGPSAA
jgi:hypothetical protein